MPSGVRQVKQVLLRRRPALVPAACAITALDAGVLPGLLPTQTVVQHPVRPQALVVGGRGAGHSVTRSNLRDTVGHGQQSVSGLGNEGLVAKSYFFSLIVFSWTRHAWQTCYPNVQYMPGCLIG